MTGTSLSGLRMEELVLEYEKLTSTAADLRGRLGAYRRSLDPEQTPVPEVGAVDSLEELRLRRQDADIRASTQEFARRLTRPLEAELRRVETQRQSVLGVLAEKGMPEGIFVGWANGEGYLLLHRERDTLALDAVSPAALELAGGGAPPKAVLRAQTRLAAFSRLSPGRRLKTWCDFAFYVLVGVALVVGAVALPGVPLFAALAGWGEGPPAQIAGMLLTAVVIEPFIVLLFLILLANELLDPAGLLLHPPAKLSRGHLPPPDWEPPGHLVEPEELSSPGCFPTGSSSTA